MVGAVERIAQEIAALDERTGAIADEFYSAYATYLTVLGQAVRQQLILASYHVCTQGYPEAFLQLTYSQRQQLQQRLRTLAQHVQEEIVAQLHKPVVLDQPADRLPLEPVSEEAVPLEAVPEEPASEEPACQKNLRQKNLRQKNRSRTCNNRRR